MNEGIMSANEFRTRLDMTPPKHKLVVWPNGANPPSRMTTFKCVKCTKGILTMPAEVVRDIVRGDPQWWDYLKFVAFGSWSFCRDDLEHPLNVPLES